MTGARMLGSGWTHALLVLHPRPDAEGTASSRPFAWPFITGAHGLSPAVRSMKSFTVESRRSVAFSGRADSSARV